MKSKKREVAKAFALMVLVVCLLRIGQICLESLAHKAQQESLKDMAKTMENSPAKNGDASEKSDAISEYTALASENANITISDNLDESKNADAMISDGPELSKYVALKEENSDLVGWLSIKGTKIDYPVMQSEDNEYYLHHDFYGEDSKYGCLYVKGEADLGAGTNFIIYGHNMKDGAMFGELDLYMKESFYKKHPEISFDTLYEERTYDIIAVFLSQVYDKEEDVFKYYQFYEADTQEDFDDFYDHMKKLSLYDTGITAQFGDTFLTLSTCAYHVKDGRLVVVAKKRK